MKSLWSVYEFVFTPTCRNLGLVRGNDHVPPNSLLKTHP